MDRAGFTRRTCAAAVAVALLASCGGSGQDDAATTTQAPAEAEGQVTADAGAQAGAGASTTTTTSAATTTTALPAGTEGTVLIEEPFDDDANGWGPMEDAGSRSTIADGAFTMEVPTGEPGGFIEYFPDVLLDEAEAGELDAVEARATVSSTSPGVAALVCHAALDFDVPPLGYFFVAYPDGHAAIFERDPEGNMNALARTRPVDQPEVPGVFEWVEGDPFELTMRCEPSGDGVRLALSIDGEVLLDVVDAEAPYEPGLVEIVGARWADQPKVPYSISYHDLTIRDVG